MLYLISQPYYEMSSKIMNINLLLQEYSVQVTFREQWNDERLRYHDDTHGNKTKQLTNSAF